jgi:hypothetical protein
MSLLFLGLTMASLVSDGTHDVGLPVIVIDSITHRFIINRETLIDLFILGIPEI